MTVHYNNWREMCADLAMERCKDCENHRWYTNRYGVEISTCTLLCVDVGIDDFCSYGERKDGEG